MCNILDNNMDEMVRLKGKGKVLKLFIVQATFWGDAVKNSYDPSNTPDYIRNIQGPRRKYYINEKRAEVELLSSNIEVSFKSSVKL